MNQLATTEPSADVIPLRDSTNLIQVIARAAADPTVDIDKMQRLMEMHERMESRQSVMAFNAAMSAMQTELPAIAERGNAAGRYTFALWEDINTAIKPVLQRHGFALSFRTDFTNGITVTGVLSHAQGHSESTSITLPADPSGNKNAVQAVASSVSYGKRYTAGALLNLTSHGEDDDAYTAAESPEAREARETAESWIDLAQKITKAEEYAPLRTSVIEAYGNVNKIPREVRAALAAAQQTVMPKD